MYVDAGAKLRIPAGTVIKDDKQIMAVLIVEPGGYVEMKGKKGPLITGWTVGPTSPRRIRSIEWRRSFPMELAGLVGSVGSISSGKISPVSQ